MKKITFLTIVIVMALAIMPARSFAQWYGSYGVTNLNELTEPQVKLALEKAQKLINTGTGCAVIGGLTAIIGGVMYVSGLSAITSGNYSQIGDNTAKAMAGAYIMSGGGALASVGIGLLIVGSIRKSDLEIQMAKFGQKVAFSPRLFLGSQTKGIGISATFTF